MGYSLDPISDNCYPGTTVLINRFDIREQGKLDEVESVLTASRIAEWLESPGENSFDFAHYREIHRFIFADLYDWAGKIRTVNISKKGTVFCPASEIEEQGNRIFGCLAENNFLLDLPQKEFVKEFVELYCTTNYLHPFREGNGRTQRVFLSQLAEHAGYVLDFSKIDTDLLMMATIQSANGVTDLLSDLMREAIHKI